MRRRAFLSAGLGLAATAAAPEASGQPDAADFLVGGRLLLRAYQGFVEEHLAGVLSGLRALARTSDARSGDWARIKAPLYEISADSATYATVWRAAADGAYSSLATAGSGGTSLAGEPYFRDLMAGRDIEGDLVVGATAGGRTVVVATPVIAAGKVVAALGASIDPRLLAELVAKATGRPAGLTFYALDAKGRAAIHGDPRLMAAFPSDLAAASLRPALADILARSSGAVTYEFAGTRRTVLFDSSYATGWRFVLAR
jgi:methyl-accepting chemotaxis protein